MEVLWGRRFTGFCSRGLESGSGPGSSSISARQQRNLRLVENIRYNNIYVTFAGECGYPASNHRCEFARLSEILHNRYFLH
jgi:hypothetical protein